jgi:transposase InsO family protein
MCKIMQVSRSGYYDYLKSEPSIKAKQDMVLQTEIRALACLSCNSYGNRQMMKNLHCKGYLIGRYRTRTLMKKANVVCKQRCRYKNTTNSKHALPIAQNVLNREFNVAAPNRAWVTDITYLWTLEGWLYIAAVLDLFSRRIVGWAMANHMEESLVGSALNMALGRRRPGTGLLHHSDQGGQYASQDYQDRLNAAGITVSMSRKGNCWDNAVMERFWGSLKSERTNGRIYITYEEAKVDVIDYIEMFYNSMRLHSTLDYTTPVQFEKQFLLKNVSVFT